MKRLVLVDGNALLHRAYHITPPFTTSKGELVNAVYGFSSMLLKVIDELSPDYMAIAWDMKAPTFRHAQYEGYKAGRAPTDEALSQQYGRVFEVLEALNIPTFKLPGFEADDLVGTLAVQAEKKEKSLDIIIVTGDRDLMQMINKRIKVMMPKKTLLDVGMYGEEEFAARYGFDPKQLIDYKALAGDSSDSIPGVPGIGEVTATKLLQNYQTLDKIYTHLKELPDRTQKLLSEGKDSAYMSQKLATIETDIPIELDLGACLLTDFDPGKVRDLFTELEFKSLLGRIPHSQNGSVEIKAIGEDNTRNAEGISITSGEAAARQNLAPSSLTTELDHEVEKVLHKMSQTGVLIDQQFLSKMGEDLKAKLKKLEQDIYSTIGHQFNINSPKQLAEIFFDELGLPIVKKTKTGRSTDEETLQTLHDAHPVVPLILNYRQIYKVNSTYVEAWPRFIKEDGRIHSTFNVEGAATGRLSSQDPNLQNIPIKGEMGAEIRKAFIAPKGKMLLGADYSQIELRIMAHLAGDPGLTKAFQAGLDIHAATAARIFKVPVEEVTKAQRTVGKTMNFATLYGQGPHALSRQLGIDYATARNYIAEYFEQFPKVKDWMQKTLEAAYEQGFTETIWGRRRYVPELKAGNRMMRAFGERAAVNHPVQGTSADMIKKAMVDISKELTVNSEQRADNQTVPLQPVTCNLILQVHDELLFECEEGEIDSTAAMVKEKMENALKLSVPVKVDLKAGCSWGEMKELVIRD
jgi:DNA polymerase I-like protein with 3'-5' exonuclease and polymerase domains/5'-3' exonuclease